MTASIHPNHLGKRPRHYAAEIVALPDKAARLTAFEKVPELYRDWVKELVRDYFHKRRCLKAYHARRYQSRF